MRHSQEEFGFLASNRALLDSRLNEIRARLMGDLNQVVDLVSDESGHYSEELAQGLADEFTANVDDLQKALWIQTTYAQDKRVADAIAASPASEAWKELHQRVNGFEEEATFDLTTAPSTLTDEQRATTRALFYCLLRMCTCPPLGLSSVGALRRLLHETDELGGDLYAGEGNLPFRPNTRLTHDGLLFHELRREHELSDGAELYNALSWYTTMPFDYLDMLWTVLRGESAAGIEDPGVVERFETSDAWLAYLARREREKRETAEYVEFEGQVAGDQRALSRIAGVPEDAWAQMGKRSRYQAVLDVLDGGAEDALLVLSADDVWSLVHTEGMGNGDPLQPGDSMIDDSDLRTCEREGYDTWWKGLTPERRDLLLRDLCDYQLSEASEHLSTMFAERRTRYEADAEAIRAWAEETGGAGELFAQYRLLRTGFFGEGLPQGAPKGTSELMGRWYPEGFSELADTALQMLLGERGLSHLDGEAFRRTFVSLGDLDYRLQMIIALMDEDSPPSAGACPGRSGQAAAGMRPTSRAVRRGRGDRL